MQIFDLQVSILFFSTFTYVVIDKMSVSRNYTFSDCKQSCCDDEHIKINDLYSNIVTYDTILFRVRSMYYPTYVFSNTSK